MKRGSLQLLCDVLCVWMGQLSRLELVNILPISLCTVHMYLQVPLVDPLTGVTQVELLLFKRGWQTLGLGEKAFKT
jgi:hypothetical protein